MPRPVPVQLDIFGGAAEILDVHVVSAHTRVRADGSQVFVSEHVRWNRGRQAGLRSRPRDRAESEEEEDCSAQLSLWSARTPG